MEKEDRIVKRRYCLTTAGNYLSLFLGIFEMFGYSALAVGLPLIEFIMKKENVFYRESCSKLTSINSNTTLLSNVTLCNAALEEYNVAFSLGATATIVGPFVLGFVQNSFGIFVTRLICGICTTSGIVCFYFYRSSAYFVHAGQVLGNFIKINAILN